MFDTIAGIPLHPLVIHAVVALVPMSALATVAVAVRAIWRTYAPWVVALDVVTLVVSFVAKQSGEALQRRLVVIHGGAPVAATHGRQGSLIPLVALALLVAGLLVLAARRMPVLVVPAAVVAVVAAGFALVWIVVVGHSGATDVWGYVTQSQTASAAG